jgi:hypothetical protein
VIQEGDPYGRHSHVGSGAEEVPGEHAEATTERGDLIVQGDFHGEVGDGFGMHPVKSGAWTSESHTERQVPARPSEERRSSTRLLPGVHVDVETSFGRMPLRDLPMM